MKLQITLFSSVFAKSKSQTLKYLHLETPRQVTRLLQVGSFKFWHVYQARPAVEESIEGSTPSVASAAAHLLELS